MPSDDPLLPALHPLESVPTAAPWNLAELDDLLPPSPLRPAAVLVGLVPRTGGDHVLLTVRQAGLKHHGGQISFPGGRIEAADRGPMQAALRETEEEVGIGPASVQPLGWLDPYATITGFHVYPLVARLDPEAHWRLDTQEVAEAFEVPLDFLLDPAQAVPVEMHWRGQSRRLVEFHWQTHRIWGATAAMLVNLRQRLLGR